MQVVPAFLTRAVEKVSGAISSANMLKYLIHCSLSRQVGIDDARSPHHYRPWPGRR